MATHAPACWLALAEFRTAPTNSVEHDIAHFIEDHTPLEGLDLLLALILEGNHSAAAVTTARRLMPVLTAEAVDATSIGRMLTVGSAAVAVQA